MEYWVFPLLQLSIIQVLEEDDRSHLPSSHWAMVGGYGYVLVKVK